MTHRDLYQVLGIPRAASSAEIRAAYTRLAKLHHPDLAGQATLLPARLQELQQAYHCLSDARARAAHDRALDDGERRHFARQRSVWRHLRRYDRRHPQPPLRAPRQLRWYWLATMAIVTALVAGGAFGMLGR